MITEGNARVIVGGINLELPAVIDQLTFGFEIDPLVFFNYLRISIGHLPSI